MALDSIHERIRQGLKTTIEGLMLPDMGEVYLRSYPDEKNITFPNVLITLEDGTEEEGEYSTYEEINVVYPTNVLICDRKPADLHTWAPTCLGWRSTIAYCARNLTTLPGVIECWDVDVRALKIVDPLAQAYQFIVSGLIVRAHTMKTRTA